MLAPLQDLLPTVHLALFINHLPQGNMHKASPVRHLGHIKSSREGVLSNKVPVGHTEATSFHSDTDWYKELGSMTFCWGIWGIWERNFLFASVQHKLDFILMERLKKKEEYWMSFSSLVSTAVSPHTHLQLREWAELYLQASAFVCIFGIVYLIIWASILYWVIMNSHSLTVCRWGHLHISLQTGNCAASALHVIMMQLQYFSPFLYFDQQRLITLD